MTWNVVIFTKEDKVEAVPKNWCISSSSECFWPPHSFKREKIFKLIESKAEPDTNWSVFPIKLLGTYGDFKIAEKKARKATISSDISSANEDLLNKKRKRKQNPKFIYSGSEESSEDSDDDNIYPKKTVLQPSCRTNYIQGKTNKSKIIKRFRSKSFSPERQTETYASDKRLNRSRSLEIGDSDTENVTQQERKTQPRNDESEIALLQSETNCSSRLSRADIALPDYSLAETRVKTSNAKHVDGRLTLSEVSSDIEFKKVVLGELTLLNLKVNAVSENVTTILNLIRNETAAVSDGDLLKKIKIFNGKLPIKTNHELSQLEEWLMDDNNYKFMVSELRSIGGQSLPQAVRKMLYRILSNEVALLYSWDGAKQKAAMKNLSLARCLLDAVKIQYPSSVDTDAISVIKIWLVKAKERITRKIQDAPQTDPNPDN